MATVSADHTGQTYGVVTVLEALPEPDNFGRRLYRVFWACCGSEAIERQIYLSKIRSQHPKGCRDCHVARRVPIVTDDGDTPGYLDVPGWGRVFPLRGPMGPRGGVGGGHTGWAKREGVEG